MLILDIASHCHLSDISFSYHRRHGNQKELIERDIERRRLVHQTPFWAFKPRKTNQYFTVSSLKRLDYENSNRNHVASSATEISVNE